MMDHSSSVNDVEEAPDDDSEIVVSEEVEESSDIESSVKDDLLDCISSVTVEKTVR